MVAAPLAAATAVAFWLSAYALVFGVLLVDLAFHNARGSDYTARTVSNSLSETLLLPRGLLN